MDNNLFSEHSKADYFKITLTISKELDDLLVKVGNASRAQKGYKLPKTLIVRSLIRLLGELNIDMHEVKTEGEFYRRLKKALNAENNT